MSDFKSKLAYSTLTGDFGHILHWLDQSIRLETNGEKTIYSFITHDEYELWRFAKPASESMTQDENGLRARDKRIAKAWMKFAEYWDQRMYREEAVAKACIGATFGTEMKDAEQVLMDVICNESGASRVRNVLKKWGIKWRPPSEFEERNRSKHRD